MGGGLYWMDHQQPRTESSHVRPATRTEAPAGEAGRAPVGAMPPNGLEGAPSAKAPAGLPEASPDSTGTVASKPLPQAPFGESEEVFETGARVYVAHCASCHGQPGRTGSAGGQFWGAGASAVAAEPVGLLFQQTANGVPPGMRGFRGELRTTEIWDVALLLRNAGQDLPDPVMRLLRHHPAH